MNRYMAQPLSRGDIRKMAWKLRRQFHLADKLYFPIVHFVEIVLPQIYDDFLFRVLPVEELGSLHGRTFPDEKIMEIREDVYNGASSGSGRDRLTIAHELGHFCMHPEQSISFARGTIKTYCDPEWQASAFAGELLIPMYRVGNMDPYEISNECGVSFDAACYQLSKK